MEKIISKYTKNQGLVDFAATKKLIAEVDKIAEARKQEILNYDAEISVPGTIYYVSNNGDDNNDGLSPDTPWQTVKKVNDTPMKEGDAVLFERGGLFRGMVICNSHITYSAYGKGPKPIITCSPENGSGKEKWSLLEGTDNIWVYYKELPETGLIVFNDGEDYSIKKVPSYINGKYVVRHQTDVDFDVRKHMHVNLAHFSEHKVINEKLGVPDISPENVCPLYLRCDQGNPGEIYNSIEFAIRDHGFRVPGAPNVTIDNVSVKYVGGHGIASGSCRNLTIRNCEFGWIGGTVQYYRGQDGTPRQGEVVRFGNAIEIYGGCINYTCDHNYIYQVFDAGVTHQYGGGESDCKQKNVKYINNLIEYCTYSIEYFLGKAVVPDTVRFQRDIYIENNILRYSGFGFGEQRPEYDGPAAHIKGWDSYNPLDENSFVRNNIFDRGRHMLIHVGAVKQHWVPTYDNNIYIQYLGEKTSSLGRYGQNPTKLTPYTENIREVMTEMNLDANAGIYFAERDELYDLPDFMPYKD